MSGSPMCAICGVNEETANKRTKLGENYVRKGSGVYTCERDRQWFGRNHGLHVACPGGPIPVDRENCAINICRSCKLHKCLRLGMRFKNKAQDTANASGSMFNEQPGTSANKDQAQLPVTSVPSPQPPICGIDSDPAHVLAQNANAIANSGLILNTNSMAPHTEGTGDLDFERIIASAGISHSDLMSTHSDNLDLEVFSQLMTDTAEMVDQGMGVNAMHASTSQPPPQLSTNTCVAIVCQPRPLPTQVNPQTNMIAPPTRECRVFDLITTLVDRPDIDLSAIPCDQPFITKALDIIRGMHANINQNNVWQQELKNCLIEHGHLEYLQRAIMASSMEQPWPAIHGIDLRVRGQPVLSTGNGRSSGRVVVFVTEPDLKEEELRWKSFYEQLGYEFTVDSKATRRKIKDALYGLAAQPLDGKALIVMFIGGAYFVDNGNRPENEMSVPEIVDTLSHLVQCLRDRLKLCVFNFHSIENVEQHENFHMMFDNHTLLVYAHSKNKDSWRKPTENITIFGQAFSHSAAQYPRKPLNEIVNMAIRRIAAEHRDSDHPNIAIYPMDNQREIYLPIA
ncbi:unnamed protein product [Oppiella nova]|uniref:Nuclear receptor domain-containing protein n=1 Tax=Oppiella nova TaxID=334625 RepID=A0A7R9QP70_9ACAR|nr:unnamed protein product [Oppiella nova]CAG2170501.1 unnamed protein product [Oppiella nova]